MFVVVISTTKLTKILTEGVNVTFGVMVPYTGPRSLGPEGAIVMDIAKEKVSGNIYKTFLYAF